MTKKATSMTALNSLAELKAQLAVGALSTNQLVEVAKGIISVDVLDFLSTSNSIRVRRSVARNVHTSDKILRQLCNDSDCYVRSAVAKHPGVSKDMLQKLSKDKTDTVCAKVASNPKTPEKILVTLAKLLKVDPTNSVPRARFRKTIQAVLSNTSLPANVIPSLWDDLKMYIRVTNSGGLHYSSSGYHNYCAYYKYIRVLLQNPNTPPATLKQILQCCSERGEFSQELLQKAVKNPRLSVNDIKHLWVTEMLNAGIPRSNRDIFVQALMQRGVNPPFEFSKNIFEKAFQIKITEW